MTLKKIGFYYYDIEYFNKKLMTYINIEIYKNIPTECADFLVDIQENLINPTKESVISQAKRIRPMICYWLLRNFSNTEDKIFQNIEELEKKNKKLIDVVDNIAIGIELLHCASLVVDDIEDGSLERRGKKSLHVAFGLPIALNTANWVYFLALKLFPLSVKSIVVDTLFACHIGQALDLSNSNEFMNRSYFYAKEDVRWSLYEKSVTLKTGKLLLLPLYCLHKILKLSENDILLLKKIFSIYGIIYQIFDDLKNVLPELNSKKLYEDLNAGIRSAVVHSFLDLLSENEKDAAYEAYKMNSFKSYFLKHSKRIICLEKCYYKASYLLYIVSVQLDTIQISKEHREYLSEIMEKPFEIIRKNIFSVINIKNNKTINEENCIL